MKLSLSSLPGPRWLAGLAALALAAGSAGQSQDDDAALARHFSSPAGESPAWSGPPAFDPAEGETIALAGGATVHAMQDHGWFETRLHRQFPGRRLRLRNIGWPADTVYRQTRPQFFYTETGDSREGSVPDQRERLEPGILMARFGKMESLDGPGARDEFRAAYARLLDAVAPFTRRVVLVAPEPFFAAGPAGDLAAERNATLAGYVEAIRGLADERGLLFADLFHALLEEPPGEMSRTGIDLTGEGQRRAAGALADALGLASAAASDPGLDEEIRQRVLEKNRLWHQYYRPTNWAFLYGDRQHVPSSRDHRDANRRWFVEELEQIPGLISAAESGIWSSR